MAVLTVYARSVAPTLVAAGATGDTFPNDGATELLIYNTGPAAVDVTFTAVRRCKHGFLDHQVETVESGMLYRAGPFAAERFNSDQGSVSVTYEDETTLTVAAQKQR